MRKLNFQTFGCKLNSFETEVMKNLIKKEGLENVTIVNSCAVTMEAVTKSKKFIRRSQKENPSKKIIVTGCAAQIEPETFNMMDEVDFVIGNEEKLSEVTWSNLNKKLNKKISSQKVNVKDIMSVKKINPLQVNKLAERSRAYVQIQNGCDHRCTFCIIPFGRGNSRSLKVENILDQIKELVDNGYNEIVLTGVDLTSWGSDLISKPSLGFLIRKILSTVQDLPRLRLSSLDSVEVDQELIEIIINEKRLMPHLHLSLQSGDNLILKRMKRRHSREQAINFCQEIREKRPKITFGADFIVGFPTETNQMFNNSLKLVRECNLTWLHVFPFSARAGTPASRMPPVNGVEIKKRAHKLRELGKRKVTQYLDSAVGKRHSVLIESNGKGRTETFAEVAVASTYRTGSIQELIVHDHDGSKLFSS